MPEAEKKRSLPFTAYQQPVLRLKFKINDFFQQVDHKADSLRRIHRRQLQLKHI